jgi:hypothetical protein
MSTQAKTTRGPKSKKPRCDVHTTVVCWLCAKEMGSSSTSRSSHKHDQHDGKSRRIFPLKCSWCDAKCMMTRNGLEKHLINCEGVLSLQFPLSCLHCETDCQDVKELSKHSHSCHSWEQDRSSDEKFLDEADKELTRLTR